MTTWGARLLELDTAAERFELDLADLELDDVEEIAEAGMTEDPGALAALLWRILQELRELRDRLEETRATVGAISRRGDGHLKDVRAALRRGTEPPR